jgi:S-(hydroxymethyl)glutathione dehydrogenase / alcohol dehydrogenase
MRAVVVHDVERGAVLDEIDVDEPGAGEVLVRVAASGVCGSDLHLLHGRSAVATFPMVLGHEGAGVVEQVGSGVSSVASGDHVVLALYGPCWACANCLTGRIVHCDGLARTQAIFGRMADGSTRLHQGSPPQPVHPMVGVGSLAELAVVRAAQVVKVPDDVPLDVICLAGCGVTTGVGAVLNIACVSPGETVAVVGCGGVGLNVIQAARLAGATTIIALDTNPAKLDLASDLGATHLVHLGNPAADPAAMPVPLRDAILGVVAGGVDHAFEVVGSPELVAAAFASTRPGGTCVMVGSPPAGATIPIDGRALFAERRLLGCTGGSNIPARDIPRIVDLYQRGLLDLDRLVTQRLPLAEFATAFADAEAGLVARSVITTGGD